MGRYSPLSVSPACLFASSSQICRGDGKRQPLRDGGRVDETHRVPLCERELWRKVDRVARVEEIQEREEDVVDANDQTKHLAKDQARSIVPESRR